MILRVAFCRRRTKTHFHEIFLSRLVPSERGGLLAAGVATENDGFERQKIFRKRLFGLPSGIFAEMAVARRPGFDAAVITPWSI